MATQWKKVKGKQYAIRHRNLYTIKRNTIWSSVSLTCRPNRLYSIDRKTQIRSIVYGHKKISLEKKCSKPFAYIYLLLPL